MDRAFTIVVVVVLVGALIFFGPTLAAAYEKSGILSECRRLEAQLALARQQGGDVAVSASLQTQLEECYRRANLAGANIDVAGETARQCRTFQTQIEQEWSHLKSTSYSDPVKRENTRNTILRIGEDMALCYSRAIDDATTSATLQAIRTELTRVIVSSQERSACYLSDGAGCGRFALNEPHGNDKASAERQRIEEPAQAQLRRATAKAIEVAAAESRARLAARTPARLAADAQRAENARLLAERIRASQAARAATGV